ncbi:MAG: hypothetical protein VW443_00375 [Pseudomonadales bacterium]
MYRKIKHKKTDELSRQFARNINVLLATWDDCIDDNMGILAGYKIDRVSPLETKSEYARMVMQCCALLTELHIRGADVARLRRIFEAYLWCDPPDELVDKETSATIHAIK